MKRDHAVTSTLAFLEAFAAGFLQTHACCSSSAAEGRASWSSSKVRSKKSCASAEMSEGIEGFAEDPICARGE